jgi:TolB-like protein
MNSTDLHRSSCPELNIVTISAQLDRVLASRTLSRATYLNRLLKCCVKETLAGNSSQLKELWLGTAVFQRKGRFNPARDPIVRVQARRLRQKLSIYYRTEGLLDNIRITLPVGSYVPVFSAADLNQWSPFQSGRISSVAVLPLAPLDADWESQRFADSMTAELTHALVAGGGLEVVSRTSALAFKGVAQDVRTIGKSLNADYIVEGCIRLAENHHRITLQLTATETGYHCWSAWFEQRTSGAPPDARSIAQILRQELAAGGMGQLMSLAVARGNVVQSRVPQPLLAMASNRAN